MAKVWGKKAQNREIILNATKKVLEKKGSVRITYQEVADAAEMSRATIFNHFPTIQSLLEAVMESGFEELNEYWDTMKGTGPEKVYDFFMYMVKCSESNVILAMSELSFIAVNGAGQELYRQLDEKLQAELPADLDEQERSDVITKMVGFYSGVLFRAFLYHGEYDGQKVQSDFRRLAEECLSGLEKGNE